MAEDYDFFKDISLGAFDNCTTPENSMNSGNEMVDLSPNTLKKMVSGLEETADQLLDFKILIDGASEGLLPEIESMKKSLDDAKNEIIKEKSSNHMLVMENNSLKIEIKECLEALNKHQKEAGLESFRLQRELEHKNLEIASLRKENRELEATIARRCGKNITEPEIASKENDHGDDALNLTISKLQKELSESKDAIENLQRLLAIQADRAEYFSLAHNDALESWQNISQDLSDLLTSSQSDPNGLLIDESPFAPISLEELDRLKNVEFPVMSLDDVCEPANVDVLEDGFLTEVHSWCREVIEMWRHDLQDCGTTIETYDAELSSLNSLIAQSLTRNQVEACEDNFVSVKSEEQTLNTSTMLSMYMSVSEDPIESNECQEEESESIVTFAKTFSSYLVENQIFHPEDTPPEDVNVFWFLLDRYLFLIDSYHNLKELAANTVNELESQQAAEQKKAEALLTHLSQLEVTDSTADLSDFSESTICCNQTDGNLSVSVIADATHDPLAITMENAGVTPVQKSRLSLNSSRIPTGKKTLPASTPRVSILSTPKSVLQRNNEKSQLEMTRSSFISNVGTPVQRILRMDPTSTAKKSVTFRSPLLARTAVEAENTRLKALLDEKVSSVLHLESVMDSRMSNIDDLEKRVTELENSVSEGRKALEEAGNEYTENRRVLEQQLASERKQLQVLKEKLILETIQLSPSLKDSITSSAPLQILTTLLETIITKCEAAQAQERDGFENERSSLIEQLSKEKEKLKLHEEKLNEAVESASLTQELGNKIQSLENILDTSTKEKSTLEEKVKLLEFEVEEKIKDSNELKKSIEMLENQITELNQEKEALKVEVTAEKDVESLKLALEQSEKEKDENVAAMKELEVNLNGAKEELKVMEEKVKLLESEVEEKIKDSVELKKSIEMLENQVAELNREKESLKAEEKDVESLKLALEQAEKEKDENVAVIKELEVNLDAAKEELKVKEGAIQALNNNLEELQGAKAAVEDEMKAGNDFLSEIGAEFEENSTLSDSLLIRMKEIRNLVQTRINFLSDEQSNANTLIETLRAQLSRIEMEKGELKEKEEQESNLVEELEKLKAENELKSTDAEKYCNEIKALEAEVNKLAEDKNCLEKRVNELELHKAENGSEMRKLNEQLEEVGALKDRLRETVSSSVERNMWISQLEASMARKDQQLTSLINKIDNLSEEIRKLNDEVKNLHVLNQALNQQLVLKNAVEEELAALKNKNESLENEILSLTADAKDSFNLIKVLNEQLLEKSQNEVDVSQLKGDKEALNEEKRILLADLKDSAALIQVLNEQLVEKSLSEDDLAQLKRDKETLNEEKKILLADLKDSAALIEVLNEQLMEKNVSEGDLAQLKSDKEALNEEKRILLDDLKDSAALIQVLNEQLMEKNLSEGDLAQLKSDKEALNEEKRILLDDLKDSAALIQVLNDQLLNKSQIEGDVAQLKADKEALNEEKRILLDDLKDSAALIEMLSKKLEDNQKELEQLALQKAEIEGRVSASTLEVNHLLQKTTSEMGEMKVSMQSTINELCQDKEWLEGQLVSAYEENDKKENTVSKINNLLEEKEALLEQAVHEVKALKDERDNLAAENLDILTKVDEATAKANDMDTAIISLQSQLEDLKEDKLWLEEQLLGAYEDSSSMVKKEEMISAVQEKESLINQITCDLKALNDEKEKLLEEKTNALGSFNEALATVKQMDEVLYSKQTEVNDLREDKEWLEEQYLNALLDSDGKVSVEEVKNLQKILEEKDCLMNKLSKDIEMLTENVQHLTKQLHDTEKRLLECENYNSEIEKELLPLRDEIASSKLLIEKLVLQLEDMSKIRDGLNNEKLGLEGEVKELVESRKADLAEKEDLITKLTSADKQIVELNETLAQFKEVGAETEKRIEALIKSSDALKIEKSELSKVIDILTKSRDVCQTEKEELVSKLKSANSEIFKLNESLGELQDAKLTIDNLNMQLGKLGEVNESLKLEKDGLYKKLETSNIKISELENLVSEYRSTEVVILRKLEEKQASDESAKRLQAELSVTVDELMKLKTKSADDVQVLNNEINRLMAELDVLSKLNSELMDKTKHLENQITENDQLQLKLLADRDAAISNNEVLMKKLGHDNGELVGLLKEIQRTMGLPEESVLNLSTDANTRSYLRMFKDNVSRTEEQIDDLRKQNHAMASEQQKLNIEIEKLSSEKVHFEIKMAEFDELGRTQEEKMTGLKKKLAKLEASMSKRSRRSDPIGPRRLEKLEEMNSTLHGLLTQLLVVMELPNAGQMRLISQREVEGASKQILDHASRLAQAQATVLTLTEEVKNMDQENQELSDNYEAQLKEISTLETKILELEESLAKCKTTPTCRSCSDVKLSLKKKLDEEMKLKEKVADLETRISELDMENDAMCNDMEKLSKEKNLLELQIAAQTETLKDCTTCKKLRKTVNAMEDEIAKLRADRDKNVATITTLEENITELKKKSTSLEKSLADTEKQLYRSLNSLGQVEGIRLGGSSQGGLVDDVAKSEKIRSLTKDNKTLKDLLRLRATTIKKLESQIEDMRGGKTIDANTSLHTNSMDSPIREKNYNLRTRNDIPSTYKRVLRPKIEGSENVRP